MNMIYDVLQNTLHLEECTHRSRQISEYFFKPKQESELEFFLSIINLLLKMSYSQEFEICPLCLKNKFEDVEEEKK